MDAKKHSPYTVEDVFYVKEPHMCRISFVTTPEAWEAIKESASWAHVMTACAGASFGSDCTVTSGSISADKVEETAATENNASVKEILYKQLQLLAEESAKTSIPEELCQFTSAMCAVADRIFSVADAINYELAIDGREIIKGVSGAIRDRREDT